MVWAVSSALEDFFESILFIAKISTDLAVAAVAAVAAKAPPQFVAFQARFKISFGFGLFDVTSESVSEICLGSAYFTLHIKKNKTLQNGGDKACKETTGKSSWFLRRNENKATGLAVSWLRINCRAASLSESVETKLFLPTTQSSACIPRK